MTTDFSTDFLQPGNGTLSHQKLWPSLSPSDSFSVFFCLGVALHIEVFPGNPHQNSPILCGA